MSAELSQLEAQLCLYARSLWRSVPASPGPVVCKPETLARLRQLRGVAPGEPVSLVVPRRDGVVAVPLVAS